MLQHFYCGGMISVTFNDRSTAQKHTLLIVNSKEIISTLALRFSEANVWRLKSYIKIKKGKLKEMNEMKQNTARQGQIAQSAAILFLVGPWQPLRKKQGVPSMLLLTFPPPTVFGTLHTPRVSSLRLWQDLRGWPPLLCHLHRQDPFLTGGSQSCSWSRKPSSVLGLFTLYGYEEFWADEYDPAPLRFSFL